MVRKFKRMPVLSLLEEVVDTSPLAVGEVDDDQGLDIDADVILDTTSEVPEEVRDILVYFTEDQKREIEDGGITVALEHAQTLMSKLMSLENHIHREGMSQRLALETEALLPGFLADNYPLASFSKDSTRTNLAYTQEEFSNKQIAIIAAIIAAIGAFIIRMIGGSSGKTEGGGKPATVKAENKAVEIVEEIKESLVEPITPQVIKEAKETAEAKVEAYKEDKEAPEPSEVELALMSGEFSAPTALVLGNRELNVNFESYIKALLDKNGSMHADGASFARILSSESILALNQFKIALTEYSNLQKHALLGKGSVTIDVVTASFENVNALAINLANIFGVTDTTVAESTQNNLSSNPYAIEGSKLFLGTAKAIDERSKEITDIYNGNISGFLTLNRKFTVTDGSVKQAEDSWKWIEEFMKIYLPKGQAQIPLILEAIKKSLDITEEINDLINKQDSVFNEVSDLREKNEQDKKSHPRDFGENGENIDRDDFQVSAAIARSTTDVAIAMTAIFSAYARISREALASFTKLASFQLKGVKTVEKIKASSKKRPDYPKVD